MKASLALCPIATPADPQARPLRGDDRAGLAVLMLVAYRGTVDDAGEGPAEAEAEVDRLLDGAYGAFWWEGSEVVERGGEVVSATLVTEYEGRPLVAFSMTAPEWQRRGLAKAGLLRAMGRLRDAGRSEVWLVVTASNAPAVAMYRGLGFVEAD